MSYVITGIVALVIGFAAGFYVAARMSVTTERRDLE